MLLYFNVFRLYTFWLIIDLKELVHEKALASHLRTCDCENVKSWFDRVGKLEHKTVLGKKKFGTYSEYCPGRYHTQPTIEL